MCDECDENQVREGLYDDPTVKGVLQRLEARARARAIDSVKRSRELYEDVCLLHASMTYKRISELLNKRLELTPRGKLWNADSLCRFASRYRAMGKKLTKVERFQETVSRIVKLRWRGVRYRVIALILNDEHRWTYHGKRWDEGSLIRFMYRRRLSLDRRRKLEGGGQ